MSALRFAIIEDELPAFRRLQKLVHDIYPTAQMVAHFDSVEDALSGWPANDELDLIFMDVQLGDGLSFDIFEKRDVPTPVIFTTAFDHYALRAFKVNSIDYLLKPIDASELKNALEKFEMSARNTVVDYSELIKAIRQESHSFKQRFLVKTGGRLTFIPVGEIAYFFSDDGNTFITTKGKDRFLLENTLEEIEQLLNPSSFFRINRKMILALDAIERIETYLNNRFYLEILPPFDDEVIVSRQRSADFKLWLDR